MYNVGGQKRRLGEGAVLGWASTLLGQPHPRTAVAALAGEGADASTEGLQVLAFSSSDLR